MREPLINPFIAPVTAAEFLEVKKIENLGQKNPWSDDSLRAELADANAFHFGAFAATGSGMLAFLLARIILDELHIHHLCTHPDFRRKGLARNLLGRVLDFARTKGVENAFLEVAASNDAAIALYKDAGFTSDLIRKKYYLTGDDAIVMSKSLMETNKGNNK
jgi:ribosomal-protein-alanine N-acetyltransferase